MDGPWCLPCFDCRQLPLSFHSCWHGLAIVRQPSTPGTREVPCRHSHRSGYCVQLYNRPSKKSNGLPYFKPKTRLGTPDVLSCRSRKQALLHQENQWSHTPTGKRSQNSYEITICHVSFRASLVVFVIPCGSLVTHKRMRTIYLQIRKQKESLNYTLFVPWKLPEICQNLDVFR
jgi:hypothetical protein